MLLSVHTAKLDLFFRAPLFRILQEITTFKLSIKEVNLVNGLKDAESVLRIVPCVEQSEMAEIIAATVVQK